jgi:hypothetical protein
MSGYIIAGYLVAGLSTTAYAFKVIRRGRVLSRVFAEEERTWE